MAKTFRNPTGITGWLTRRYIKNYDQIQDKSVRASYGYLEGWVSCVLNFFLAGIKLVIGIAINSQAVIADAVHSASDMLTSAIVIFGFKAAKKPKDQEHPFGHANAELIASLVMSVLLIVAGVELLQMNAISLMKGEVSEVKVTFWVILAMLGTIVIKEWLFYFSKDLSQAIGSTALDVDAWHHRMDSITTVLVILSLIANYFGIYWLDKAMGITVAGFVIWTGVELAKDAISPLLGEMVDEHTLVEIREVALAAPHVGNVHDIMVHKYGEHHYITMHMEILDGLTPTQMHDIAAEVSHELAKRFNGDCNIHVDPVEFDSKRYLEFRNRLLQLMDAHPEIIDFHDLQFRDHQGECHIFWEFSLDPKVKEEAYPHWKHKISNELNQMPFDQPTQFSFSLEPGYTIKRK